MRRWPRCRWPQRSIAARSAAASRSASRPSGWRAIMSRSIEQRAVGAGSARSLGASRRAAGGSGRRRARPQRPMSGERRSWRCGARGQRRTTRSSTSRRTARFREPRTRILKHGDTFAVFDQRGDIVGETGNPDGLYHHDTRFLSQLELRLNGARPLLLSSNAEEDNAVSDRRSGQSRYDRRGRRRAARRADPCEPAPILWQSAYYELLLVHNFDVRPHAVTLGIRFAADFADLFEVSGQQRARRGQISAERLSADAVALALSRARRRRARHDVSVRAGADPPRYRQRAVRAVARAAARACASRCVSDCGAAGERRLGGAATITARLRAARRALKAVQRAGGQPRQLQLRCSTSLRAARSPIFTCC